MQKWEKKKDIAENKSGQSEPGMGLIGFYDTNKHVISCMTFAATICTKLTTA
jgi:hypothetical protein